MEKNAKVVVCPIKNGILVYPKSSSDYDGPPIDAIHLKDKDALDRFFREHITENPEEK